MRIHHLSLAALLALTASADAKPRHIAIVDFDGPRALADAGRAAVVSVLGETYDLVSTKRWEAAKMANVGRGPMQWSSAAKQSGVDAIVEGWVDPEGMRTHTMTVAVRDASTGRQIDTVSVKISDKGVVSEDATRKLTSGLDDLLTWVSDDASTPPRGQNLVDVRTQTPGLGGTAGAKVDPPAAPASNCDNGDDDDDDDDDCSTSDRPRHREGHGHRGHHGRRHHARRDDDRDDDRDHDRSDDRRANADRDDRKDDTSKHDDSSADAKPAVQVATADPATAPGVTSGTASIIDIFGPDSVEAKVMTDKKDPTVLRPSPKFEFAFGTFAQDRGMSFTQDPPDFAATPPSYPATGMYGITVNAAVFPKPIQKYGSDLTGFGGTFRIQKSLGASISANDTVNDTYGDYSLDYTSWEGAAHYRYPIVDGLLLLDGQVSYGRSSYQLESDFPASVQIPDVAYEYLGVGGTAELAITERSRITFGARYLYTMSVGDASDEEWYGSGTAAGLELSAGFRVPLGDLLYLKADFEYRRFSMDFDGDGNLSTAEDMNSLAVSNITDSSVSGSAEIGVSF
jgi:hypothetical protein